MSKQSSPPAHVAPRRSLGAGAGPIELEGPGNPILTPPPARRVGLVVATTALLLLTVGVAVLAFVNLQLLIIAAQAFVGKF